MSKFLDLNGLTTYDGLIKQTIEAKRAMPLIARNKAEMDALLTQENVNKQVKYMGLEKETVTTELSMPKPTMPPQQGDSPTRLYINPYYYDADLMHGNKGFYFNVQIKGSVAGEEKSFHFSNWDVSTEGCTIDKLYSEEATTAQIYHYDSEQEQWVSEEKVFAPGWNLESKFLKGSIENNDLYVDLNEFNFDSFYIDDIDDNSMVLNTTSEWLTSEEKEITLPYKYGKIYEIQMIEKEMTVKEIISPADEGFRHIQRGDQVSKIYFNTLDEHQPSFSHGVNFPEFVNSRVESGVPINRVIRLQTSDLTGENNTRNSIFVLEDRDDDSNKNILVWHPDLDYSAVIDLQDRNFDNVTKTISWDGEFYGYEVDNLRTVFNINKKFRYRDSDSSYGYIYNHLYKVVSDSEVTLTDLKDITSYNNGDQLCFAQTDGNNWDVWSHYYNFLDSISYTDGKKEIITSNSGALLIAVAASYFNGNGYCLFVVQHNSGVTNLIPVFSTEYTSFEMDGISFNLNKGTQNLDGNGVIVLQLDETFNVAGVLDPNNYMPYFVKELVGTTGNITLQEEYVAPISARWLETEYDFEEPLRANFEQYMGSDGRDMAWSNTNMPHYISAQEGLFGTLTQDGTGIVVEIAAKSFFISSPDEVIPSYENAKSGQVLGIGGASPYIKDVESFMGMMDVGTSFNGDPLYVNNDVDMMDWVTRYAESIGLTLGENRVPMGIYAVKSGFDISAPDESLITGLLMGSWGIEDGHLFCFGEMQTFDGREEEVLIYVDSKDWMDNMEPGLASKDGWQNVTSDNQLMIFDELIYDSFIMPSLEGGGNPTDATWECFNELFLNSAGGGGLAWIDSSSVPSVKDEMIGKVLKVSSEEIQGDPITEGLEISKLYFNNNETPALDQIDWESIPDTVRPHIYSQGSSISNGSQMYIDTSKETELVNYLNNLTYSEEGLFMPMQANMTGDPEGSDNIPILCAVDFKGLDPSLSGYGLAVCNDFSKETPTFVYSTIAVSDPDFGDVAQGFQNLDNGIITFVNLENFGVDTIHISVVNDDPSDPVWNGEIIYSMEPQQGVKALILAGQTDSFVDLFFNPSPILFAYHIEADGFTVNTIVYVESMEDNPTWIYMDNPIESSMQPGWQLSSLDVNLTSTYVSDMMHLFNSCITISEGGESKFFTWDDTFKILRDAESMESFPSEKTDGMLVLYQGESGEKYVNNGLYRATYGSGEKFYKIENGLVLSNPGNGLYINKNAFDDKFMNGKARISNIYYESDGSWSGFELYYGRPRYDSQDEKYPSGWMCIYVVAFNHAHGEADGIFIPLWANAELIVQGMWGDTTTEFKQGWQNLGLNDQIPYVKTGKCLDDNDDIETSLKGDMNEEWCFFKKGLDFILGSPNVNEMTPIDANQPISNDEIDSLFN